MFIYIYMNFLDVRKGMKQTHFPTQLLVIIKFVGFWEFNYVNFQYSISNQNELQSTIIH